MEQETTEDSEEEWPEEDLNCLGPQAGARLFTRHLRECRHCNEFYLDPIAAFSDYATSIAEKDLFARLWLESQDDPVEFTHFELESAIGRYLGALLLPSLLPPLHTTDNDETEESGDADGPEEDSPQVKKENDDKKSEKKDPEE